MRKKLRLTIVEHNQLYGTDELNNIVLHPEDFRSTVSKSISLGMFREGDIFEIDVDTDGNPKRRSFDQTVAIHAPIEKRYSRQDVVEVIKKVLRLVEAKEPVVIESLL